MYIIVPTAYVSCVFSSRTKKIKLYFFFFLLTPVQNRCQFLVLYVYIWSLQSNRIIILFEHTTRHTKLCIILFFTFIRLLLIIYYVDFSIIHFLNEQYIFFFTIVLLLFWCSGYFQRDKKDRLQLQTFRKFSIDIFSIEPFTLRPSLSTHT